jgi:hypothetical protein
MNYANSFSYLKIQGYNPSKGAGMKTKKAIRNEEAMRVLIKIVGNRIGLWSHGGHSGTLHEKVEDDKFQCDVRMAYEWLKQEGVMH